MLTEEKRKAVILSKGAAEAFAKFGMKSVKDSKPGIERNFLTDKLYL